DAAGSRAAGSGAALFARPRATPAHPPRGATLPGPPRRGTSAGALPCALALAVAALPAAALAQPAIERAPAFAGDALVAPPTTSWPTNGGNWLNQRYSPLTEIDRGNVTRLAGVWRTRLGSGLGPQYSGEAQPIVFDGVIYVVTGANDVFAIAVETGEILWDYRANLDPTNNAV